MSTIDKIISSSGINQGTSSVNLSGKSFQYYDSSTDTANLLSEVSGVTQSRFDDTQYYSQTTNKTAVVISYSNDASLYSDDSVTWNTGVSLPSSSTWTDVTQGAGKFVAVAYNTDKLAVRQTLTWSAETLPSTDQWGYIFYAKNKFIVNVNNGTKYLSSPIDLQTWTTGTLPSNSTWINMQYGKDNYLIAINGSSNYATSSDLSTWTLRSNSNTLSYKQVAFINNQFFLVAETTDKLLYSSDAINWSTATLSGSYAWRNLAHGKNIYVIIAQNNSKYNTSADGITWTERTFLSGQWKDIVYKNNNFNIIADGGSVLLTSPDGLTWTQRTVPTKGWSAIA